MNKKILVSNNCISNYLYHKFIERYGNDILENNHPFTLCGLDPINFLNLSINLKNINNIELVDIKTTEHLKMYHEENISQYPCNYSIIKINNSFIYLFYPHYDIEKINNKYDNLNTLKNCHFFNVFLEIDKKNYHEFIIPYCDLYITNNEKYKNNTNDNIIYCDYEITEYTIEGELNKISDICLDTLYNKIKEI